MWSKNSMTYVKITNKFLHQTFVKFFFIKIIKYHVSTNQIITRVIYNKKYLNFKIHFFKNNLKMGWLGATFFTLSNNFLHFSLTKKNQNSF